MRSLRNIIESSPHLSWPLFWLINTLSIYVAAIATLQILKGTFSDVAEVLLPTAGITVVFMSIVFGISRIVKRTDLVDVAWGLAISVVAIASFIIGGQTVDLNIQTLVAGLIIIWGVRLSYTISLRFRRTSEDKRYIELRKKWRGSEPLNAYLRIFITQAILATIVGFGAVTVNAMDSAPVTLLAYSGAVVWLIGFLFETVGDWQLKKFLADPKNRGKLMTKGLWQYTRHPNYFGEATQWWGIFIIALSFSYGWVAVLSPLLITYLLLYVSGVPLTEKAFNARKGWTAYQKQTSMFFPLPPKNK